MCCGQKAEEADRPLAQSHFKRKSAPITSDDPLVKRCDDIPSFEEVVQNAPEDKLIVIDFYAEWCSPCKMMYSHYHNLADEFRSQAIFLKVDVDINEDLAALYDISCMPTFVFFKNNKKIDECSGTNSDKLKEIVKSRIQTHTDDTQKG